ncbi:MAG: DNA repair protein RecN [Pseudomonadota bacterium]
MLSELSIRDIVLIEKLTIRFDGGMSVLTGETGAGKSILLDALSLALGARGDAQLVRQSADQGHVTAVFDLPVTHPVRAVLTEAEVDVDDGEPVMLRRVQNGDGRTRAFVNDQSVSASLLSRIGSLLVEIHGQHDNRALVDTSLHRVLLDAFGRLHGDVAHVGECHAHWRAAQKALAAHRNQVEEAAREADFLRAANEELMALAPEPGEEEQLAAHRADMMKSEKVASDLHDAEDTLGGPKSPIPAVSALLRRLERKAAEVPGLLEETNENLAKALDHLAEAQNLITRAVNTSDFNPSDLERTEERLFALRAAGRKYNVMVDELPALTVRMADQLAALDAGEERLAHLERVEKDAADVYDRAAAALSQRRKASAVDLEEAVMAELPALKLEKARFMVALETDAAQRAPHGSDDVAFHVQTNPGSRAGPIMKVASGGELSRFLLALKVALADKGSAPTLVFDEIDTGVGGAVADAIGSRLALLADGVQVLSVTHAPQVAARAGHHFLIAKSAVTGGTVATDVRQMDDGERREELARMLSGATITDEARAAAVQLLTGS